MAGLGIQGIGGLGGIGGIGGRRRQPAPTGGMQGGAPFGPTSGLGGGLSMVPTGGAAQRGMIPPAAQQRRMMPMQGQPQSPSMMGQLRQGLGMAGLANKGYEWLSGSPTGLAGGLGLAGGALGGASALQRVTEGKGTPADYVTLAKLGYNAYSAGAGAGAAGAGAAGTVGTVLGAMSLPLALHALSQHMEATQAQRSLEGGSRTLGRYGEWGVNPNELFKSSISDPWGSEAQKQAFRDTYGGKHITQVPAYGDVAKGGLDTTLMDRNKVANYLGSLQGYKGPQYSEDFYHDLTGDLLKNSALYGLDWSGQLAAKRQADTAAMQQFLNTDPGIIASNAPTPGKIGRGGRGF